ncbi:MAG TPA: toprim domain-containing protein [Methanosarcina sp.]|nr:toprim domain-containing protein [Methanosarcina sp.]
MTGVVVDRLPHVCGTRRGLNVFQNEDGTYSGWCFSCKSYVVNPYEDQPADFKPPQGFKKTPEEIAQELKAIGNFPSKALTDRKLSKETLEHFQVRVAVSEENGEDITAHYYPYTNDDEVVAYKCRIVEGKKFWFIGEPKSIKPFGWNEATKSGSKRLYITEGEIDAMSLFQVLKQGQKGEYAAINPAVVSLSRGSAAAAKEIAAMAKEIRQFFKEIVLVFDMDDPGKKAVEDVMKILPESIVANLPAKDASECLKQGREKALFNACVFNAQKPKNTRLILADTLIEDAKKAPEWGVPWPWKHVTEVTRGIRLGETIYIGAGQKQGKSEVVNTLAAYFIRELGWKVLLAKPEESNVKSVKMVAGKLANRIFHDPKIPFDEEAYNQAALELRDHLYLLNLYQHVGWETLKADIREAALLGCKAIFIDPITNLTNGINAADANTKLQEIAQELSAMALDLGIVIFIFCHLRNPDNGPPHERGGEVLSSQFAGSRAMARSCNLMLGLEGNRDPNLPPEQRNMRTLVLLEDREYGETGRFPLYWDKNTGAFNELERI